MCTITVFRQNAYNVEPGSGWPDDFVKRNRPKCALTQYFVKMQIMWNLDQGDQEILWKNVSQQGRQKVT
jgi:hypothetical protein